MRLFTHQQYNIFILITIQDIMHPVITSALITFLLLTLTQAKLYQVVALLSPGARYHINDLYDGSQTKSKWGEITPVGLRQQQSLGRAFRKDYVESVALLSKNYNKDEYQLITTTANRTIQSGLSNLYGMYSLGNGQKLQPASKQYHIPPYTYTSDIPDPIYALPQGQLIQTVTFNPSLLESCPNSLLQIQKNIRLQLADYNEMVLMYTPFLKRMATTFKIDPNSMNFTKLSQLYDTIRVDRYLGRSLPTEFGPSDLQNIEHLYNWYNHFTLNFNLSKAYNTFTLNQTIQMFDAKIKSINSASKWLTISAEQTLIITLQNALNISTSLCIEELFRRGQTSALNCEGSTSFASSILFELHSDNAIDFYVKVRNNGKYVNLCEARQTSCAYNNWRTRVNAGIVSNPTSICGKPQSHQTISMATQ